MKAMLEMKILNGCALDEVWQGDSKNLGSLGRIYQAEFAFITLVFNLRLLAPCR